MAQLLKKFWHSRDFWLIVVGALALVVAAFWVTGHFVQPAPPKHIVMATGPEGGAYEGFAKLYQRALAAEGIELELRSSRGAQDNLRLLKDDHAGVTMALVQGGVAQAEARRLAAERAADPASAAGEGDDGDDDDSLMSLAALYHEPLWVFYRGDRVLDRLQPLRGKRLAIGQEGSGARVLALELLAANGIDARNTTLMGLPAQEGAQALEAGQADAVLLVGAPESALVTRLMRSRALKLMSFAQAEAYSRQFPYLSRLVLPEGSFALGDNIPARDVSLVSPTANLVVRDDIHPALITLLMSVVTEVHGGAGMLHREGEFPSPKGLDIGLSLDAERYMKSGPSFLHQHLPFWIAVWIDRLIVMLIPLVAVLLPVMKLAPAVYTWRVKSRIYRWYGRLKELEYEIDLAGSTLDAAGVSARLDEIERGVSHLPTPLAFAENLYNLRAHVELVRARLMQTLSRSA